MTLWTRLCEFFRRENVVSDEALSRLRLAHDAESALEDSLGTPEPRKRERLERARSKAGAYSGEWRAE